MSNQKAEPEAPEMRFHSAFEQPVDDRKTILRSNDGLHFYFRLSFLSEFSSFFRDLPPTNDDEIIELPRASGSGLSVCLRIIRAFCGPHDLPRIQHSKVGRVMEEVVTICDAYDLQCVLFQLSRCQATIFDLEHIDPEARLFLDYALAALTCDFEAARAASKKTLQQNILLGPKWISDILSKSCPLYLIRLHELHSRHLHMRQEFLDDLSNPSNVAKEKGKEWHPKCNRQSCPNFQNSNGDWPRFRGKLVPKVVEEVGREGVDDPNQRVELVCRAVAKVRCERCRNHLPYAFPWDLIGAYIKYRPRAIGAL